jgi:N-acetyl-gamma-glutamyl-phosphate reductase
MSRLKVALLGAAGYTGAELIRLIDLHPELELVYVGARENAGQKLGNVIPALEGVRGLSDLVLEAFDEGDAASLRGRVDVAFTALPHAASARLGGALYDAGVQVIDLSADFRLRDLGTYETWYGPHPRPDLLPKAVYGLPELYARQLEGARLIACPGCYPTSAILPLVPLLRAGLITLDHPIIVDSKSGVSGAGRKPGAAFHLPEAAEGMRPYKVAGTHRHTPEIEQEISVAAGRSLSVLFTPQLAPMSRGILTNVYAGARAGLKAKDCLEAAKSLLDSDLITILPEGRLPDTLHVRGSGRAQLGYAVDERTGLVLGMCTIDNLARGASAQAICALNLSRGWALSTGVPRIAQFP